MDKNAGEVLAVVKEENSPQNHNHDGQRQTAPIHEQMKEKDVHNHRAKKDQGERHVAIHEQQRAARDLNRRDYKNEMRSKERTHKLAGGSWRQRLRRNEMQETIQPKYEKGKAK